MKFILELELLLKSKCPILYINTYEEERLEYVITKFNNDKFNFSILYWDFVNGYNGNPNHNSIAMRNPSQALDFIYDLKSPYIIILRDFYLFFNDNSIVRKLRNLVSYLKKTSTVLIITANDFKIPISLREIINVVNFPLPTEYEIKKEIDRIFYILGQTSDNIISNNLIRACKGLTFERIRRILCKVLAKYGKIDYQCFELVLSEKKQIISQTQILEFIDNKVFISDVGGLNNLKNWLALRSTSFSNQAKLYGLPYPKGLLLAGVQGTGKSLVAKAIANEWNLPLLHLDIGKLFGGVIGESEFRTRQMIEVSESLAPCILWIDEIDKGFSGLGFTNDSGTTSRVFATFITWLSEKQSSVFVVATANNINVLPLELLRKGRFDEIFFIGLPSFQERKEIFTLHLSKLRSNTWQNYDIDYLSKISNNFSGAEIKQAIVEAMYIAFNEKREFDTNDIINSIDNIIPLARSHQEELQIIENWASAGKVRRASN